MRTAPCNGNPRVRRFIKMPSPIWHTAACCMPVTARGKPLPARSPGLARYRAATPPPFTRAPAAPTPCTTNQHQRLCGANQYPSVSDYLLARPRLGRPAASASKRGRRLCAAARRWRMGLPTRRGGGRRRSRRNARGARRRPH